MLKAETRRALLLYTKRAEALRQTKFAKQIEAQGKVTLHLRFHRDEGPSDEHRGPDLDAITVGAARVRQFIQRGEPISFPKMAQILGDPDVSSHWQEQFREVRQAVNAALDDALPYVENGETLTRRQLLDIFLNGELFHTEEGKVTCSPRLKLGASQAIRTAHWPTLTPDGGAPAGGTECPSGEGQITREPYSGMIARRLPGGKGPFSPMPKGRGPLAPSAVEVFERWQAVPLFYPLVEFELVNTIAFLMNAILFLSHLCQFELAGGGEASGPTERE